MGRLPTEPWEVVNREDGNIMVYALISMVCWLSVVSTVGFNDVSRLNRCVLVQQRV